MPGRAEGHEPKVRRTVIDKEPAQSVASPPSGSSAASDGSAVTRPGDAPGEASALHHASARHAARAYYAVA